MKKYLTLAFLFLVLFQVQATTLAPCISASITTSPVDAQGCLSESVSFSVSASGTDLTYQWQENSGGGFHDLSEGSGYANVQTSTLGVYFAMGMANTAYRCVVTASCGAPVISGNAYLQPAFSPNVYTQPSPTAGCIGDEVTFSILADGTELTYQWQQDAGGGFVDVVEGSSFTNVETNTLKVNLQSGMDGTTFRCVVSGKCTPVANSDAAALTINTCTSVNHAADRDEDLILYPNPAQDVIHLSYSGTEAPVKIFVYNVQGKEVLTFFQTHDIPVHQLSSGLYTLEMIFEERIMTRKFSVE